MEKYHEENQMPREQDSREREEKRGNLSKEILATAISLVGMFAGTILAP